MWFYQEAHWTNWKIKHCRVKIKLEYTTTVIYLKTERRHLSFLTPYILGVNM